MPSFTAIDTTLTIPAIVETAALIALIAYVVATWRIASANRRSVAVSENILREMKETRDQDMAPYVVAYFDVPHGSREVYLVVKNLGRRPAIRVRLHFEPELKSTIGELNISAIPFIRDGIPFVGPGQEFRTLYDITLDRLGKTEFPLSHSCTITYGDGSESPPKTVQSTLDLSSHMGSYFVGRKGIRELVDKVDSLAKSVRSIERMLKRDGES